MKHLYLLLASLFIVQGLQAQMTIATARTQTIGTVVTVRGIVTNGDELGVIRYIQDGTAGIGVYDPAIASGINLGDSLEVTGEIDEFRQLLEIVNTTSHTVINSGNPLPAPIPLSIAGGFNEAYEGELVTIQGVDFVDAGAFSTSSDNYDITDGTNTGEVRINGTTNIAGTLIPDETVDVTGIMSQFDFSDPLAGYQLLPRTLSDFDAPGNPPIISSPLSQTNLSNSGFTVSFTTLEDGNTIIYYGETPSLGSTLSDAALSTMHSLDLTGLNAGTIYYVQGASVSASGDTSYSAVTPMATVSNSTGAITAYFNRSVDVSVSSGVDAVSLENTLADTLIAYIDRAQNTLDIAIYNLDNDNGVVDAINAAHSRGVAVRVIANTDVNAGAWSALSVGAGNKKLSPSGGAPGGGFYGLMHNKFMLIDADDADPNVPLVWTGGTNWTDNQLVVDANDVIIVQDQSLARAYTLEFEEMWSGAFGPEKTANTPVQFEIGGRPVQLYFAPTELPEDRISEVIMSADHDLQFAVFQWTRWGIAYDIEDEVDAGVFATGVIDEIGDTLAESVLTGALGDRLRINSVSGVLHHKYLLIDALCENSDPIAWIGSGNFSGNGFNRSDENFLVIHDAAVANQYYQEWVARYAENGGTELTTQPESCDVVIIGIDETTQEDLALFPNPASDRVWIDIDLATAEQVRLDLVDLSGRLLQTRSERAVAGYNRFGIDLNGLADGAYLVRVSYGERSAVSKLMVGR